MGKIHTARFTLQFDENNPIHFNAISILNEKERNKANYIAELIWEKEYGDEKEKDNEKEKKESLKALIKEALLEVLKENPQLFANSAKVNKGFENGELVLNDKKQAKMMAGSLNKEVIQGLSAFGIKQR